MPLTLGYWNIRGRGQIIRLYMHYLGEKYEEKLYVIGKDDWKNDKFNLGLDFPNLPYLIGDGVKLTQTMAILRYIADKHNQLGSTVDERAQISMLEGAAIDLRMNLVQHVAKPDYQDNNKAFFANMELSLKIWNDRLGKQDFLTGNKEEDLYQVTFDQTHVTKPLYVDFILYEAIVANRYFARNVLEKFKNLCAFRKRIEDLPGVKEYINSPEYIHWPLHAPLVHFGALGEKPF